jgi:hypothetical protein
LLGNKGTREYLADKVCNLKKLKFFDIIFIENKKSLNDILNVLTRKTAMFPILR